MPSQTKDSEKNMTNGNGAVPEKHMANGDMTHSQFLEHLQSFPVVSDTITHCKSQISSARTNPYTATPLRLLSDAYDGAYTRLYEPAVPYLRGPWALLAPYLAKADLLGDSGLQRLEARFPIVKDDAATVRDKAAEAAALPWNAARRGRDYVRDTYVHERGEVNANGVVGMGFAVVRTEWRIATDFWTAALRWWAVEKRELDGKKQGVAAAN